MQEDNNQDQSGQNLHFARQFEREKIKYTIFSKQSQNQILQFILYPKQQVFIQGQVLYSNSTYLKIKQQINSPRNIFIRLKSMIFGTEQIVRLVNNDQQILYFGIRMKKGGGKILVLDSEIYGELFYVHPSKILMTNLGNTNAVITRHTKLSSFESSVFHKSKKISQNKLPLYFLQCSKSSILAEKSLGKGQKMIFQQKLLVGFSETVQLNKELDGWVSAKGPGWIFIENSSESWGQKGKNTSLTTILCWVIIVWILLASLLEAILIIEQFI